MIQFKKLFSFTRKQVQNAFDVAKLRAKAPGLALLQGKTQDKLAHGKLLIITPKSSGKASKRNRFRRQAKSIFYQEKLYEKPVISILIVYKEGIETPFEKLKTFLGKIL